jgi:large subunit ribosomal protein L15
MPGIEQIKHPSNVKQRKRKGYGQGSGLGRTAGRGQKGYGSRSGNTEKPRFEGGQQPLVRHIPKLGGFKHHNRVSYYPINLASLAELNTGTDVDVYVLDGLGLLPKKVRGMKVKLLAGGVSGDFGKKLNVKLHAYSSKAREIIERAGGTCEVI